MSESLSTETLRVTSGQEPGTVSRGHSRRGQTTAERKHPWVSGLGETNLGGFILMTSFSNSSTISLLRLIRDPQAIIVVDGVGNGGTGAGEGRQKGCVSFAARESECAYLVVVCLSLSLALFSGGGKLSPQLT